MICKFFLFFIISSSLVLSSCSQKITPNFLRDREYDYQRHSVVQPEQISIPKGVDAPDFAPIYSIPEGRNVYSPSKSEELSEVLPPPGFPVKVK